MTGAIRGQDAAQQIERYGLWPPGPGPCVHWYIGRLMTMPEFRSGPGQPQTGCWRRALGGICDLPV